LLLSDAVTCALVGRSTLSALIRSPTVSVPVDVYVVVVAAVVTVIVPPARIPKVCSEVPVVSGTVPTAVAGVGVAGVEAVEELVLEDEEELLDDVEVSPLTTCSAFCTSAESAELVRFKAVPLAMLASPLAWSTIAVPITPISEAWALEAEDWACCWDQ